MAADMERMANTGPKSHLGIHASILAAIFWPSQAWGHFHFLIVLGLFAPGPPTFALLVLLASVVLRFPFFWGIFALFSKDLGFRLSGTGAIPPPIAL